MNKIRRGYGWLIAEAFENKDRWILWIPVFIGAGIFLYFSLKYEPSMQDTGFFLMLPMIGAWLSFRRFSFFFVPFIITSIVAMGFMAAHYKTITSLTPSIEKSDSPFWIRATIEQIEHRDYGYRLTLKKLDLWQPKRGRLKPHETPEKIRVNIRTDMEENLLPGERVSFKAFLTPPAQRPAYPGGYDFSFIAYFKKIGAVGYSITDVKRFHKDGIKTPSFEEDIAILRHKISANIRDSIDNKKTSGIAAALITGDRGTIDKDILDDMRKSGLGHLLAISGLHMGIVMAGFFFISRAVFALIPRIVLHYNIKKWSAIMSLFVGLFYLFITGMPVSAQRAYIMASLFFLAILLDRTGTPMRPISYAAIIIMLIAPESVLGVSFQMSFAASFALIAAYEVLPRFYDNGSSLFKKFSVYLVGIVGSSIIAGLAIAPFAIYHFGTYANYGLLANIIAIPLTSFVVMPFGILSLLLMPFGLEGLFLAPMSLGLEIITSHASYVSGLESSSILVRKPCSLTISIFTLSLLWLMIWRTKVRLLSLPILFLSLFFILSPAPTPNILIDESGKLFALKGGNGDLIFSTRAKARYAREQWLSVNAQEESPKIKYNKSYEDGDVIIDCSRDACSYITNGKKAIILESAYSPNNICDYDIIINLGGFGVECVQRNVITLLDLNRYGTHAIWLKDDIKIKTVEGKRGLRPWVKRSF